MRNINDDVRRFLINYLDKEIKAERRNQLFQTYEGHILGESIYTEVDSVVWDKVGEMITDEVRGLCNTFIHH